MNEETMSLVRRVADVEATPQERLFLFARAEENPEIWRELAMRLVEEAHWRKAIQKPQTAIVPVSVPGPHFSGPSFRGAGKIMAMIGAGIAAGFLLSATFLRPHPAEVASARAPLQTASNQQEWHRGNPRLAGLPATEDSVEAVDEAIVPLFAREKLKRLGVEVEESTVIFLVENDSGSRVAFPSRQAAFRFVNDESPSPKAQDSHEPGPSEPGSHQASPGAADSGASSPQ